ncbi:MAG TPA: GGDEF domain-containing protein [Gemmatimonadales bacterium]|nr:GGDEF domain-containing protein [Gemmatimonadales bacterium]
MLRPPTAALAAAGAEGERSVAWARLVVTTLLMITPTWKLFLAPADPIYRLGFVVTAAGFSAAILIWMALRRGRYGSWIGFASSGLDVSLVTLALALFTAVGLPLFGVNSRVTYEVYFLAIAATALRYDARIVLAAGGLAIAQYGALVGYTMWRWDLTAPGMGQEAVGPFSFPDQVTRLILMVSAVLLAWLLVYRAQKLQQAASTDPLTSVGNRAYFDRRADAEFERARRYGRPLAVALVDVDHFKTFNDVHGHPVGDAVLVTVADTLSRRVRRTDVLARYGGEEFALLFPETAIAGATNKLEAIRRAIEATQLDLPDDREPSHLTISAGVATFPADGRTLEALIAAADECLLRAKREGRNRVVTRLSGGTRDEE